MSSGRPRRALPSLALVMMVLLAAGLVAGDGAVRADPVTLRVLAGGELADMGPVLAEAARATGVRLELDLVSTLDGTRRVARGEAGAAYEATWLATNRYLQMFAGGTAKMDATTNIMSSPVILGVRRPVAERLGARLTTWAGIAQAAADRRFTFGMSDPASSNSAVSALICVANASADTGAALRRKDVPQATPRLRALFHAQSLTTASTEKLAGAFAGGQATPADGLIAYESELLALNASGRITEPLTLIYPGDGVVTATYPFTLLASAGEGAREAYTRIADYLTSAQAQQRILRTTWRRPVGTGGDLPELPFPASFEVIEDLVAAYQGTSRRPARTVFVLDVSGSMAGSRLDALRNALGTLTAGPLVAPEQLTLLPFSSAPGQPSTFELSPAGPQPSRTGIQAFADGLSAQGGTAVYDALSAAFQLVAQPDPERITTVVLLSDGENNRGRTLEDFLALHRSLPDAPPVLPILFGEANAAEMQKLAEQTGGHAFDGRTGSLSEVFVRIRSSR